jgi:hypothetical protein
MTQTFLGQADSTGARTLSGIKTLNSGSFGVRGVVGKEVVVVGKKPNRVSAKCAIAHTADHVSLDWPLTQFGVFGHFGAYTGSVSVFKPVLSSPAHAAASLAMPPIEIEVVWIL